LWQQGHQGFGQKSQSGDHAAYRTRKKGDWKGLSRKKQKRTKHRESQIACDERGGEKWAIGHGGAGKSDCKGWIESQMIQGDIINTTPNNQSIASETEKASPACSPQESYVARIET
jgi:hypothetical protein